MLRSLGTYLTDMESGGLCEIVCAAYNHTEGTLIKYQSIQVASKVNEITSYYSS